MTPPLTPAAILRALERWLTPLIAAKKGRLIVAKDAFDALSLLAEAPAGFRLILNWNGDDPVGDDGADDGVVVSHIDVTLSNNVGLTIDKHAHLTQPRAGQQPLLELVSQIRAKVRALAWPDGTSGAVSYRGCEPVVTPEGFPLDAYKLKFDLMHNLPVQEDVE